MEYLYPTDNQESALCGGDLGSCTTNPASYPLFTLVSPGYTPKQVGFTIIGKDILSVFVSVLQVLQLYQ